MAIVAIILAIVPTVAFAAAEAHHEGGTTSAQWLTLGFTFINFSIFFFLIRHYARTPLRDYLSRRRKGVVEALAAAARATDEAERVKKEYEEKAAQLGKLRDELVAEIAALAAADREKALAAAAVAAERLRHDAELTSRSDLERARRELRAEAARLATELATSQIRERITDGQRARLLSEFLREVGTKQ